MNPAVTDEEPEFGGPFDRLGGQASDRVMLQHDRRELHLAVVRARKRLQHACAPGWVAEAREDAGARHLRSGNALHTIDDFAQVVFRTEVAREVYLGRTDGTTR